MEAIRSAAWKFQFAGDKHYQYFTGNNHGEILRLFAKIGLKSRDRDIMIPGFMTTNDRFVTRKEALPIAIEANQLVSEVKFRPFDELDSNDLLYPKSFGKEYSYVE